MPENAEFRPVARAFMPAVAPKAISATTRAYSTRSWPSSLLAKSWNFTYSLRSVLFMVFSPGYGFPASAAGHPPYSTWRANLAQSISLYKSTTYGRVRTTLNAQRCIHPFTRSFGEIGDVYMP